MKIKFFSTGGTVDKVCFDQKSTYRLGKSRVEEILKECGLESIRSDINQRHMGEHGHQALHGIKGFSFYRKFERSLPLRANSRVIAIKAGTP